MAGDEAITVDRARGGGCGEGARGGLEDERRSGYGGWSLGLGVGSGVLHGKRSGEGEGGGGGRDGYGEGGLVRDGQVVGKRGAEPVGGRKQKVIRAEAKQSRGKGNAATVAVASGMKSLERASSMRKRQESLDLCEKGCNDGGSAITAEHPSMGLVGGSGQPNRESWCTGDGGEQGGEERRGRCSRVEGFERPNKGSWMLERCCPWVHPSSGVS